MGRFRYGVFIGLALSQESFAADSSFSQRRLLNGGQDDFVYQRDVIKTETYSSYDDSEELALVSDPSSVVRRDELRASPSNSATTTHDMDRSDESPAQTLDKDMSQRSLQWDELHETCCAKDFCFVSHCEKPDCTVCNALEYNCQCGHRTFAKNLDEMERLKKKHSHAVKTITTDRMCGANEETGAKWCLDIVEDLRTGIASSCIFLVNNQRCKHCVICDADGTPGTMIDCGNVDHTYTVRECRSLEESDRVASSARRRISPTEMLVTLVALSLAGAVVL